MKGDARSLDYSSCGKSRSSGLAAQSRDLGRRVWMYAVIYPSLGDRLKPNAEGSPFPNNYNPPAPSLIAHIPAKHLTAPYSGYSLLGGGGFHNRRRGLVIAAATGLEKCAQILASQEPNTPYLRNIGVL